MVAPRGDPLGRDAVDGNAHPAPATGRRGAVRGEPAGRDGDVTGFRRTPPMTGLRGESKGHTGEDERQAVPSIRCPNGVDTRARP